MDRKERPANAGDPLARRFWYFKRFPPLMGILIHVLMIIRLILFVFVELFQRALLRLQGGFCFLGSLLGRSKEGIRK
jgi:hypothetical protein